MSATPGGGQERHHTHSAHAPATFLPGARSETTPTRRTPRATSGGGHPKHGTHSPCAPASSSGYAALRLLAEMFFDVQEFRKAAENKARSGTVDELIVTPVMQHYEQSEKLLSKALVKCFRQTVPPGVLTWQAEQLGIGEHLLARLLGAIGNPRVAAPKHWEGRGKTKRVLASDPSYERTVSQLWSYCGVGDPSRTLHKGITADELLARGNPRTKALVWNIAAACVKAGVRKDEDCDDSDGYDLKHRTGMSNYGALYLDRRGQTIERVHAAECVRCGPAGNAAQPGTPWSPAHQHADALRIVGKEVLRDLWRAAK